VVLALGAASLLAVAGTVAAGIHAGRASLDLTAALSSRFSPRIGPDGRVVNAYEVSFENRGRGPLTLRLSLSPARGEARVSPDRVELAAGEHRRVLVVASAAGLGPGPVVEATLSATGSSGGTVAAQVPIFLPRAP
jgi:hypothetical protein